MSGTEHISQEELASYVMQSLAPEETASIRTHLQDCALCRSELALIGGDLALFAMAVEQAELPAGARDRFLAKISGTADTKPVAAVVPITEGRRRGKGFWIPWATVAALAIVSISLGVQNRALNEELKDESNLVSNLAAQASRAQQVLEVLTAPQAQRVTLTEGKASPQPAGRATYLPERGGLILQATNLKPLPAGKTYELWIIPANGNPPVPAGLFHPDDSGSATVVLPPLQAGIAAKVLAVTIENAGGAASPTMPIVLAGAVGS